MQNRRFTCLLISLAIALLTVVTSCQKDAAVTDPNTAKADLGADSAASVSAILSSPGNYLAASGILLVKINDSTYTFDAARDSIAFVNVHIDDNSRYFGITAINKEHTMSFGISSSGYVLSDMISGVAGSQFLLNPAGSTPSEQYSLSKYAGEKDFGNVTIGKYNQGNELAKGTFFTFLAKDDKANAPFYRVEGSFDLQFK